MSCSFVLVNETLTDFFQSLSDLILWTCYPLVYSGNGLWKEVSLENFKWSQAEVSSEEIQIPCIYVYIYRER